MNILLRNRSCHFFKAIAICFVLFSFNNLIAQTPSIEWVSKITSPGAFGQSYNDIVITKNGETIAMEFYDDPVAVVGRDSLRWRKISSTGSTVWAQAIAEAKNGYVTTVGNGDFVITGTLDARIWVARISGGSGGVIWESILESDNLPAGSVGVEMTKDTNFLVAGTVTGPLFGEINGTISVVNKEGEPIGKTIFSKGTKEITRTTINKMSKISENTFAVGGSYFDEDNLSRPASWVSLINGGGGEIWNREFGDFNTGGPNGNNIYGLDGTEDGGLIVLKNASGFFVNVTKLDAAGETVWSKNFNGRDPNGIRQTPDGGYLFAMRQVRPVFVEPAREGTILLTKLDADGNEVWKHTYGGAVPSGGIELAVDGGYYLAGVESTSGGQQGSSYLVKLQDCRLPSTSCALADFDYEVDGKTVGFINRSSGKKYTWNFGDGTTSDLESPVYEYGSLGDYTVSLVANQENGSWDTLSRMVRIRGVNEISPRKVAQGNLRFINFEGFGFNENTTFLLRSPSGTMLRPDTFAVNSIKQGGAVFDIPLDAELGRWDVIAVIDGNDFVLPNALTIQEITPPKLSVNIIGPSAFRTGRTGRYTVQIKNSGNSDAFMVPILISGIPGNDKIKVNLVSELDFSLPQEIEEREDVRLFMESPEMEELKNPITYDSILNEKFMILSLPVLIANSTNEIIFELFNDGEENLVEFNLMVDILDAFIFLNSENSRSRSRFLNNCQTENLAKTIAGCGGIFFPTLPFSDCIDFGFKAIAGQSTASFVSELVKGGKAKFRKPRKYSSDLVINGLGCAFDLISFGGGKLAKAAKHTEDYLYFSRFGKKGGSLKGDVGGVVNAFGEDGENCLGGIKGLKENSPCDSDGDDIPDELDNCPNEFGEVGGCPDSDGDGVPDKLDECKDDFGEYSGCPDSDGDGLPDQDDRCPRMLGEFDFLGCPKNDRDGDGLTNDRDSCPDEWGYIDDLGCPKDNDEEEEEEEEEEFEDDPSYEIKRIRTGSSEDPNEKYVSGWSEKHISPSRNQTYTIAFENLSAAAFAAQKVVIIDTLDQSKFNLSTFRFLSLGFDEKSYSIDKKKQFFELIDLQPEVPLLLSAKGVLDEINGVVRWEFISLDPTTLLPTEDDLLGFLPPNLTSPEGEGFVSFSIRLWSTVESGEIVKNKAEIFFDTNQPIITNEVESTIDLEAPESLLNLLEFTDNRDTAILSITGTDNVSGIATYQIFVSDNIGTNYPSILVTNPNEIKFPIPDNNLQYELYSIAIDNVENIEAIPNTPDVVINPVEETTCTINISPQNNIPDTCNQGVGAIIEVGITQNNTTPPIRFEWSTGKQGIGIDNITPLENLAAGTYTLTLKDNLDCTSTATFTISNVCTVNGCPDLNANVGDACTDNNDCTENDMVQADCSCAGTFQDSDKDGTCDQEDRCPNGPEAGTLCEDNNPNTIGTTIQSDCSCGGGSVVYECPILQKNIGDACTDNDDCTENDIVQADCSCAGTFQDSDKDGTCDQEDRCPNGPEAGTPCEDNNPNTTETTIQPDCSCGGGSVVYECPTLQKNIGDACTDNDDCTENDIVQADCSCAGSVQHNGEVCDKKEWCVHGRIYAKVFDTNKCECVTVEVVRPTCQTGEFYDTRSCSCKPVPIKPSCDNVTISADKEAITITNLTAPIESIIIFNSRWHIVYRNIANCKEQEVIPLEPGKYFVKVTLFTASWRRICRKTTIIQVGNTSDGTSGNNDSTQKYQCGEVTITYGNGGIHLLGQLGKQYYFRVLKRFGNRRYVLNCTRACGHEATLENLKNGKYYIQVFNRNWSRACAGQVINLKDNSLTNDTTSKQTFSFSTHLDNSTRWSSLIYPNPAKQDVFIDMKAFEGQKGRIQLVNQSGQVVQQLDYKEIPATAIHVDIHDIEAGLYFLNITLDSNQHIVEKMLIHRE